MLPLCEKLCDADEGVRQKTRDVLCQMWDISIPKAISTLEKSGWKPMNDETKVQYWLIKKEYAKCAAVGNAAIEPLINELDHVYYSPSDESEILKALERFGDDIVKRGHKKIDEARESIEDGKLRAKWREDWEKNWGPNE